MNKLKFLLSCNLVFLNASNIASFESEKEFYTSLSAEIQKNYIGHFKMVGDVYRSLIDGSSTAEYESGYKITDPNDENLPYIIENLKTGQIFQLRK